MTDIKQIDKDLLTLAAISTFVKTRNMKLTDYIQDYNKEQMAKLTLNNLKDEEYTDSKITELINDCYNRVKKKFK